MLRNISLANRLDQLCKGAHTIINSQSSTLSDSAVAIIDAARADGMEFLSALILPIFGAISEVQRSGPCEIMRERNGWRKGERVI